MFTKRHYQAIAEAMQKSMSDPATPGSREIQLVQWKNIRDALADMFARDNGSFKKDLFLAACQPGANVNARTVKGTQKSS